MTAVLSFRMEYWEHLNVIRFLIKVEANVQLYILHMQFLSPFSRGDDRCLEKTLLLQGVNESVRD